MSDIADVAGETIELHLGATLAAKRAEMAANSAKESADECVCCGELIPSERQIAIPGVDTCVMCATAIERLDELRV